MALPGNYSVTLSKRVEGALLEISTAQSFALKPLFDGGLVTDNRQDLFDFQIQSAALYRAVTGADSASKEIQGRIDHLLAAVGETPSSSEAQAQSLRELNTRMQDLQVKLNGDKTISRRAAPVPMSISGRINNIVGGHWDSQSGVTDNYRDSYVIAEQQFRELLVELKSITVDLSLVEAELQAQGAPWTPGRIPDWP
jgi:hypothetical protein